MWDRFPRLLPTCHPLRELPGARLHSGASQCQRVFLQYPVYPTNPSPVGGLLTPVYVPQAGTYSPESGLRGPLGASAPLGAQAALQGPGRSSLRLLLPGSAWGELAGPTPPAASRRDGSTSPPREISLPTPAPARGSSGPSLRRSSTRERPRKRAGCTAPSPDARQPCHPKEGQMTRNRVDSPDPDAILASPGRVTYEPAIHILGLSHPAPPVRSSSV